MRNAKQILDYQFLEMRWRCLSLAADLDRIQRASGGADLLQDDSRLRTLRKAIDFDPVNASVHNNLGIALASAHRAREAVGAFHRAVELSPNFVVGYSNLGLAMVHAGRPDDSIVWLERAIEMKPDYAEAHCNLGIALTELGQLDKALNHYSRALELDPNYADARYDLATRQWATHDLPDYSSCKIYNVGKDLYLYMQMFAAHSGSPLEDACCSRL